jgi:hypothetical protein
MTPPQVNKLNGQLQRTEQQAQQATVKKNREGAIFFGLLGSIFQ